MGEPLIESSSIWLSALYFLSFLVDLPLPMPTLNIGHGIHDDTRSGIDYHEFCELAHAAFLLINFYLSCAYDATTLQHTFGFYFFCIAIIGSDILGYLIIRAIGWIHGHIGYTCL